MIGQRVEYDGAGGLPDDGTYWKDAHDGHWYAMTPNGHLAGLARHEVTEHEDGTITVRPSIKVWDNTNPNLWHGYLERGVWREV